MQLKRFGPALCMVLCKSYAESREHLPNIGPLADVKPSHFLSSPTTLRQAAGIASDYGMQKDQIILTFKTGPYKGTWVHPELAVLAANYLDNATDKHGALARVMAKALCQLSRRSQQASTCSQDTVNCNACPTQAGFVD